MTPQEIFDKVVTHLLTQNARSFSTELQSCMYRNEYGMMCAVGCLIKDDVYFEEIEKNPVGAMIIDKVLIKSGIPIDTDPVYECLLLNLQQLHDWKWLDCNDKVYDVSEWETGLQDIAAFFGLDYNGVPQ